MTDRIEIKAQLTASEDGTIEGVAWPFSSPDRTGDVIGKGAMTMPERLPMLWAHDQGAVVGVWESVTETSDGIAVKGRLLIDDVEKAREARALVRSGAVGGLSIGFITKESRPQRRGRTITRADLLEISLVSVPAHPGARITSAKAAAAAATQEDSMSEETQTDAAPDTAAIEAKLAEVEAKADTSKLVERLDKIEAKANRMSTGTPEAPKAEVEAKALGSFLRNGMASLDEEDKKNLNLGTNSAGGFVTAPEYSTQIIEKITEISPMRQAARVMAIGTTEVLFPVVTTKLSGGWVTETGARPESQPVFDQIKIETHEQAVIVPMSQQLVEDSFVDLPSYIAGQIAEQFAASEATAFVNGDGSGKPFGFLQDSTVFTGQDLSAAGNAADIVEAVIALFYKLQSAYARNATWTMNRATMGIIRQAADTTTKGAMWSDGLADGTPARLLGRPVVEATDMADLADGSVPIALGDFNAAYTVVDRTGVQLMRDDFTGADNGIVKIRARRRVGGRLLLAEPIVVMNGTA